MSSLQKLQPSSKNCSLKRCFNTTHILQHWVGPTGRTARTSKHCVPGRKHVNICGSLFNVTFLCHGLHIISILNTRVFCLGATASKSLLFVQYVLIHKILSHSGIAWPLPRVRGRVLCCLTVLIQVFWMLNFPFCSLYVCVRVQCLEIFSVVNHYLPLDYSLCSPFVVNSLAAFTSQQSSGFHKNLKAFHSIFALVLRLAWHWTHAHLKPTGATLPATPPAAPVTHRHSTH